MRTASSTRPPGHPTTCTAELLAQLCAVIRRTGCSDSAAAAALALSSSSLSRWKQADPAFALRLLQARQEFRTAQLDIILAATQTRSGWRAAAWLLERIFPEDYSPRAKERAQFQALAAAALPEPVEAEAPAATEANPPLLPAAPLRASEGDSHNSRNSAPLTQQAAPASSLPRGHRILEGSILAAAA